MYLEGEYRLLWLYGVMHDVTVSLSCKGVLQQGLCLRVKRRSRGYSSSEKRNATTNSEKSDPRVKKS